MLSALTGDGSFASKASGAARALFDRRSPQNLFGKHINVRSGKWVESLSGVGSNSDSFYEYLLKSYVLFQDHDSYRMFEEAYSAIDSTTRQGDWFADVDMCHFRVDGAFAGAWGSRRWRPLDAARRRRRAGDATPSPHAGTAASRAGSTSRTCRPSGPVCKFYLVIWNWRHDP